MLAKPEYFSPPNEVCAGRGAVADRLVRGTAVAERHREDVAYCSTADAELLLAREPPAQRTADRGAVAEQGRRQCESAAAEPAGRLAGAPWRSKGAAARLRHGTGAAVERGRRQYAGIAAKHERPTKRKSAAAGQWRWQKARAGAGRQILSDSPSDLAITSAAQVLPYVFTAVRGISQSC